MKLIGVDVGTTGCKAIVFDAQGGILGHGFREYGVICDAPAKAEQDAEQVWFLAKEALREAVAEAGNHDIRALSVSVQGDAVIPVDGDFRALHPAILGMDYRSAAQADHCAKGLGAFALFQRTGMRPHPMNSLTKVLLLRDLAPAVFGQAARIVTYADFILGKLGGEAVIDYTMASRTMAFELGNLGWSETIHKTLDLDAGIWSRPVPSGTVIGPIRRTLAEELGLPPSLVLVTGGHDQTCAALGAGAVYSGLGVISTGTAEVLSTALPQSMLSKEMFESFYPVGGGAKSPVWLQLKADILNRPLRTLRSREAACLGAALLAGTAVGIYKDLAEAVAETVQYEREFVPMIDHVTAYVERYAIYKEIHPTLRGLHSRI